jgi:hypothetical protein
VKAIYQVSVDIVTDVDVTTEQIVEGLFPESETCKYEGEVTRVLVLRQVVEDERAYTH